MIQEMVQTLSEAGGAAKSVAGIIALTGTLTAPIAVSIKKVEDLFCGHRVYFAFCGSIAALIAFLAAGFGLKDSLHRIPVIASVVPLGGTAFFWLGLCLVMLVAFFFAGAKQATKPRALAALCCWMVFFFALYFGMTELVAEHGLYRRIYGPVTVDGTNTEAAGANVFVCMLDSAGGLEVIERTVTNARGEYQFLLMPTSLDGKKNLRIGAGWESAPDADCCETLSTEKEKYELIVGKAVK